MKSGGRSITAWRKAGLAFAALFCVIAATAAEPVRDISSTIPASYTDAVIISPADDTAVRSNVGNLTVRGQVSPKLESGHRAQLLLDGVPQGAPSRTLEFSLENIDRGTHRLRIRILDVADNPVFSGAPSTFHLLRHSRLHP